MPLLQKHVLPANLLRLPTRERPRTSLATLNAVESGRAGEIGFTKLTRILAAVGLELKLQRAAPIRPTLEGLRSKESEEESER